MDQKKTELEKRVEQGIYGSPELKQEERSNYLGEFRERILKALTKNQVEEPGVYSEIMGALRDPQASKLVMRRDVDLDRARDYLELAQNEKVAFKRVDSPKLKGDIGLVVASSRAVDVENILVPERKHRLKDLGFSDRLIQGVGGKLCSACWQDLESKYPEELVNYRRIRWVDRLIGIECIGCSKKK